MHPSKLSIKDFTYQLPDEKIALFPLKERDAAKLLVYKNGRITVSTYKNIAAFIPRDSLLVYNNTKVIRARILFEKPTGGIIEIFLLEPYQTDYQFALTATTSCRWKCLIGGASKWKKGPLMKQGTISGARWTVGMGSGIQYTLHAKLIEKLDDAYVAEFSWQSGNLTFAEILENCGNIPLPPYIKRKPEAEDKERYQTIYAFKDGSVAAPTAGLHFTEPVFDSLQLKKIRTDKVTLHVGAGTFKPVKAVTMQEHVMHEEWMEVSYQTIENILGNLYHTIVALGTTSLRTIESLYWMGVKTILNPEGKDLKITQWQVYDEPLVSVSFTPEEALVALLNWMKKKGLEKINFPTQILIAPGYSFKIVNAIITNFHQPQSTLLLLVAAATGQNWKQIYSYALQQNFRFLSYGDGNLLFIQQK